MSVRASAVEKASSWITTPPALTVFRSSRQVATLKATRMSTLSERAMCPSGVMRSWYQVGRPSMLDGKTFFGATGIPMWKMARVSTRLAVWLPEPLTVAAWMVRSLTLGSVTGEGESGILRACRIGALFLTFAGREGRRPERAHPRRAPSRARAGHGNQAHRGQAGRGGPGRRGGGRLHPGRGVSAGRGKDSDPRGRPVEGRRRRAQGAGAHAERGRAAGHRLRANQLPAAGDTG